MSIFGQRYEEIDQEIARLFDEFMSGNLTADQLRENSRMTQSLWDEQDSKRKKYCDELMASIDALPVATDEQVEAKRKELQRDHNHATAMASLVYIIPIIIFIILANFFGSGSH